MSPSFLQMVGALQSKVEEELEGLDVRSRGPTQLGRRAGVPRALGYEENRSLGASNFPVTSAFISLIVASPSGAVPLCQALQAHP